MVALFPHNEESIFSESPHKTDSGEKSCKYTLKKKVGILLFISLKFCYLVNSTDQRQLVVLNINKSSDQQHSVAVVQPREKMSRHCYFKHLDS